MTTEMMLEVRGLHDPCTIDGVEIPSDDFVRLANLLNEPIDSTKPTINALLASLSKTHQEGRIELRFAPFCDAPVDAPGVWNLQGDQAFEKTHPLSWNYLDPSSPNHLFKTLQKRVYLHRLRQWLDELVPAARVLDVGGGIGRFGVEWLERGYRLALCDPNPNALSLALGHLAAAQGSYSVWQLGAERMSPFADESIDLVSAFEVMCYLSDPMDGLREAARIMCSGGLCFVSVESSLGAKVRGQVSEGLPQMTFGKEGDVWVHFYTRDSLAEQLSAVGLTVENIMGTQYVLDGPQHDSVDLDRLGDPTYQNDLIRQDQQMDETGSLQPRAWLAVARKP